MTTSRRLSTWKENQTQGIKQTSDSFSTPKQHHSQVYQLGHLPQARAASWLFSKGKKSPTPHWERAWVHMEGVLEQPMKVEKLG